MGQTALVMPDILDGGDLVQRIRSRQIPLIAALWWLRDDEWRLLLASPNVDTIGPLRLYEEMRLALEAPPALPSSLYSSVEFVSPKASVITILNLAFGMDNKQDESYDRESVNGVFIPGAHIYFFNAADYFHPRGASHK
ncbi:hypothetical protein [Paludibaculum fermentans]|uniref:hypothetical protein n=1 Tax=Paludibaculum fermentans TaxID=1473598 RepID=UPI003EBC9FEE